MRKPHFRRDSIRTRELAARWSRGYQLDHRIDISVTSSKDLSVVARKRKEEGNAAAAKFSISLVPFSRVDEIKLGVVRTIRCVLYRLKQNG